MSSILNTYLSIQHHGYSSVGAVKSSESVKVTGVRSFTPNRGRLYLVANVVYSKTEFKLNSQYNEMLILCKNT